MALVRQVKKTIEKYRMLARGDGVLAAVSGGPDSVALLHVLARLKDEFDLRLEVAHVEHGIRGTESKADARFVGDLAERLALPFHLKEVALPRIKAELGKGNLEALGREARYRFFAETAVARRLEKIATGHTRDDQAETVLMRLLRGSARKGLGAMAPVLKDEGERMKAEEKIHPSSFIPHPLIIRPLIETSRQDIESYLAAENLQCRVDRTNQDTTLLRNWVRLDLLPQLKEKIDRGLDRRLARMADVLRDEEAFLDAMTRSVFQEVVDKRGDFLRLPLLAQPKAMQRRLVRLWLEGALGHLRGVNFDHVEAILGLISDGPPQARIALPRGREAVRSYDTVSLKKNTRVRRAACCYSYALPLGGEIAVPEAGVKIASARSAGFDARPDSGVEAAFDLKSLPEMLTVRNFRNGDRFQPLGMQGHKKVKDLFIAKKVPLPARATLPLLIAGEEILWIPGYGRSEVARIGPTTKEALKVKIFAIGDRPSAERSAEGRGLRTVD